MASANNKRGTAVMIPESESKTNCNQLKNLWRKTLYK